MAYLKINPSGCEVRKNRMKLRLDLFLSPNDPNYAETIPNHPFHVHFIHPELKATTNDIKAEIHRCFDYFYTFRQYCWNEGKPFIEEWQKVPKRVGDARKPFVKGDPSEVASYEIKLTNILSRLTEFEITDLASQSPDLNIGERGTIDIGASAINRASNINALSNTCVEVSNPANATGTIEAVDVYIYGAISVTQFYAGTFSASGNVFE
jgi:hypothetical protein